MKYVFLVQRKAGRRLPYVALEEVPVEIQVFGDVDADHEHDYLTTNSVFIFESNNNNHAEWAQGVLKQLAKTSPGCVVEMFRMEQAGHCPPGDFVGKSVDADGSILPLV